MTDPNGGPLTYEEAKDFQSNISNLSANEKMGLNGNTKRLVGQLNADLKSALADAADTQGKGHKFMDAMREYSNAMKLSEWKEDAIKNAWRTALRGAGLYEAAKLMHMAGSD